MREHPNAAVVRNWYEASARAGARAPLRLTPLAVAAAGDLVVVIDHLADCLSGESIEPPGVALFRVTGGRIAERRRIAEHGTLVIDSTPAPLKPTP